MVYKKNFLLAIAFFLLVCPLTALADVATRADFNGTWTGSVAIDGENSSMNIRIVITSNGVSQYFQNEDGTWRVTEPDNERYAWSRNNLVYAWVNQGGVWSETQIYSLSLLDWQTLGVIFSRHVNNYEVSSDNETWNLTGTGLLRKDG
jgi:hypothetical protein